MTMYEAIFLRQSVRKYSIETVSDVILNGILNFHKSTTPLYDSIETNLEIINACMNPSKIGKHISVKAPYYLVLYSEKKDGYLLNAGCIMEQIVLYLCSKGIDSCFIESGRTGLDQPFANQEAVTMIAFGYGRNTENLSLKKKYSLEQICVEKEKMSRPLKKLLEAGRLAPSSLNSQPWRFVVYNNRMHVFLKRNPLLMKFKEHCQYLNMGIMLAHILVTSEELWIDLAMEKMENIENKPIKGNEYMISVLLK